MRTELFMHFCIMNYMRTKSEVCQLLKYFSSPLQVVYTTDRSKVVVPVFCVALWFIPRALNVQVFSYSLSSFLRLI